MKRIVRSALVVFGLGCLAALPARALDVPPATTFATCQTSQGNIQDPLFCQTGTDLAQVTLGPVVSAQASADYPGNFAQVGAGGNAGISYRWGFVGGNPGDLLHVEIDIHLLASSYGSANSRSFASVIAQTNPTPFTQVCVETGGLCGAGNTHSFDGAIHVLVRSGDLNTMSVQASAGGTFLGNANGGVALADPHIFLDPAFPTTGYTLVLSPGVGNSPPVPEPGAGLMMAAGLAALGWLSRRRA